MNRIILNETSYYGAGCRTAIADEIKKRGFSKVLLVTDKDLIKFGVAAKIEEVLKNADIPYEIYSEIKPNPTIKNVLDGLAAFKASGADCMVALGGAISGALRTSDVAARYSSCQCVVILPEANSENGVMIAQRIAERFYKSSPNRDIELSYDLREMEFSQKKDITS